MFLGILWLFGGVVWLRNAKLHDDIGQPGWAIVDFGLCVLCMVAGVGNIILR